MRKNVIIVICLGILIGYVFGNIIFNNYEGKEYIESDGNIYYVQYGVYTTEEAAKENSSKLDNYKIVEEDDKYYIYLGVTTSHEVALKIQEYYKGKDIYTYIRSDYVTNSETLDLLKEFDKTLEKTDDYKEINEVMKEIFENNSLKL